MATKSALIFSPFFFGLLFLVSIAFISEHRGGVSGQSCSPGTGSSFGAKVYQGFCVDCSSYCTSLPLPVGYSVPNSGVKTGQCYSLYAPYPATPYLCLCCVA
ncbi:hypothetical protein MKW94_029096 [Papaver nudicaule]|uniref:Uncharacterized protein n=1 Tax=Papaver nudicaule TaxID=74823 RepID=A0AA42AZR2_PAPNU|nr:hypothetical protein [Papaver nudicaule]